MARRRTKIAVVTALCAIAAGLYVLFINAKAMPGEGVFVSPSPSPSPSLSSNPTATGTATTTLSQQNQSGILYTNATGKDIQVELPYPEAVTGKTFSVIGKARGYWFFEGSFPVRVLDSKGKAIFTGIATAEGDWMTAEFVPFRATIKAPESFIGRATLVLVKDNPSGMPEHDASVSFPITIEY